MSATKEIELILARHLGENLAMPIFLIDAAGRIIFCNETADRFWGESLQGLGALPIEEWIHGLRARDEDGKDSKLLSLLQALAEDRPSCGRFWLNASGRRCVEYAVVPLQAIGARRVGALVIFSESNAE